MSDATPTGRTGREGHMTLTIPSLLIQPQRPDHDQQPVPESRSIMDQHGHGPQRRMGVERDYAVNVSHIHLDEPFPRDVAHSHPHSLLVPENSSSHFHPSSFSANPYTPSSSHASHPDPPAALARFLHASPSLIGKPVAFSAGRYYEGKTIRAEIFEIQGAVKGRKCADAGVDDASSSPAKAGNSKGSTPTAASPGPTASTRSASASMDVDGAGEPPATGKRKRKSAEKEKEKSSGSGRKDRRPLDPPPVVKMRLFEVDPDTNEERELTANEEDHSIHICHVDLFAMPADFDASALDSPNSSDSSNALDPVDPATLDPALKRTEALVGSTYVAAAYILDQGGAPASLFVFRDLSVKQEGIFRLRYRVFDVHSTPVLSSLPTSPSSSSQFPSSSSNNNPHNPQPAVLPVLAECTGRPFRVYSTKLFPGLEVSTPLTLHLNRWGVKVNFREGRRVRSGSGSAGGGGGEGGGRGGRRKAKGKEKGKDRDGDGDEGEDGVKTGVKGKGKAATGTGTKRGSGRGRGRGRGGAVVANANTNAEEVSTGDAMNVDEAGPSSRAAGKRRIVDDEEEGGEGSEDDRMDEDY